MRRSLEDPAYDADDQRRRARSTCWRPRALAGAQRVVNTSTGGAIYGEVDVDPDAGEHPAAADGAPTGRASSAPSATAAGSDRLYGLSTVTLRYGNVYGPRQDPHGDAGVIAIFCGKAAGRRAPDDLRRRRARRATTSSSATSRARTSPAADDREVARRLQHRHGDRGRRSSSWWTRCARPRAWARSEFEPIFEPARLGELQRSALDAGRARADLGFAAQTPLREGIAATFAWARDAAGNGAAA